MLLFWERDDGCAVVVRGRELYLCQDDMRMRIRGGVVAWYGCDEIEVRCKVVSMIAYTI